MSEQSKPKPRTEDMVQLSELPITTDESQDALSTALDALLVLAVIEAAFDAMREDGKHERV